MIFEHEIPAKSRLYFGASAKAKRDLEYKCSRFLYDTGFEEIVTPLLSYHQHQSFGQSSHLIKVSDESNHELTLRADSTIDVVRIVTKRLGKTTSHKKWFYIQPVITYPSKEAHQVGAEILEGRLGQVLATSIDLFDVLGIKPFIQVSNIQIPKMLHERYGIDLDMLKNMEVQNLLNLEYAWIEDLLRMQTLSDLHEALPKMPDDIARQLRKMQETVQDIQYPNLVLSPLYYAKMQYYQGLTFRAYEANSIIARGGEYENDNIKAAGFTINTDEILKDYEC
jgi:ATP phosphoribosyltransferase regulatory subunit HisZ